MERLIGLPLVTESVNASDREKSEKNFKDNRAFWVKLADEKIYGFLVKTYDFLLLVKRAQ